MLQLDSFWYGVLVIFAMVVFGFRVRKSIKVIAEAKRKAPNSVPYFEWLWIVLAVFLGALFLMNLFGLL